MTATIMRYFQVATVTGSSVHLSGIKDGLTLCGRSIANQALPASDRMCTRCEKIAMMYRPPADNMTPVCPAHGVAVCIRCSRIGTAYIVMDDPEHPQCCGCEHWGATGMHWDTCPCRVHGDIVIHPKFRDG